MIPLERAKAHLKVPAEDTSRDAELTAAVAAAELIVAALCNTEFAQAEITERVDGSGDDTLYVSRIPTSVLEITFDSRTASAGIPLSQLRRWSDCHLHSTPPAIEDVLIDRAGGLVRLDGGIWPRGRRNIIVRFPTGYTPATVPADLAELILMAMSFLLSMRGMEHIRSESHGDYSVTLRAPGTRDMVQDAILELPGAAAIVERYRRSVG